MGRGRNVGKREEAERGGSGYLMELWTFVWMKVRDGSFTFSHHLIMDTLGMDVTMVQLDISCQLTEY